ncbi:contact-dependent growth inhibition system immunity protein [Agromyces sp. MMS24-JH15]|uniref:contact-dependent growth inhibition system immunity protein n=1 Tax=Agromyces sp. MMS24-JH15 TaxID=3243765 RepID=UPI00374A541D
MGTSLHWSQPRHLAQGYFHQGFDLDAAQPIGVVRNFREQESETDVEFLRGELAAAIAGDQTEDKLARFWIEELGSSYDPRRDGGTTSEWFRRMLGALS